MIAASSALRRAIRHLALALLALAWLSCGSATSGVSVGGNRLTPKDAVFWSGAFPLSTRAGAVVVIGDQGSLCKRYPSADACGARGMESFPGDGTFIVIEAPTIAPGEFQFGAKDLARSASLRFAVVRDGAVAFSDEAISGTVSFSSLTTGSDASGTFSANLKSGETASASFQASYCRAFDDFAKRIAEANLSCTSSLLTKSCDGACTCAGRVNTAHCDRADSNADWSCSCSFQGTASTCTVPRTTADVCAPGNSCCALDF